jgi:hypothetical protein
MTLSSISVDQLQLAIDRVARDQAGVKRQFSERGALDLLLNYTRSFVDGVMARLGIRQDKREDDKFPEVLDADALGNLSLSLVMFGIALGRYYEMTEPDGTPKLRPWSPSESFMEH